MIKSVMQYIPSHVMSIFLLLHTWIDEIEKMLNAFWWGLGISYVIRCIEVCDLKTFPLLNKGGSFRQMKIV